MGDLVPDAATLLAHVWDGVDGVRRNPASVFLALATTMMLYHVKDWVPTEKRNRFYADCPFAQTLGELANGTKHFELTHSQFTADPHVADVTRTAPSVGGLFNAALFNTETLNSSSQPGSIRLRTRRFASEAEASYSAWEVIYEVFQWWQRELA